MTELEDRFMFVVAEMAADFRERYEAELEEAGSRAATDAYATGISTALNALSLSELLWELNEEKLPVPITQNPEPGLDTGFDRLCEIVIAVWEQHRSNKLEEWLGDLEE